MPPKNPRKERNKDGLVTELPPEALRKLCDPVHLSFNTTDDLPDLQAVIGQPRAFRALELGSEVSGPGYNTFVLGQPGSGRTTLTYEYLQRKAANEPVPDDWCYVNNFDNPHQPKALPMPAGKGIELRKDMQGLVERCERDVPRLYESEEYTRERDQIVGDLKKNQEAEFIRLQKYVEKYSFVIARTPYGFVLAPAVQGKQITQEDLERLSPEQRTKLEQLQTKLGDEVEKTLTRLRDLERTANQLLNQLNERTILFLIDPLIQALKEKYAVLEEVVAYLEDVQSDIIANPGQFRPAQSEGGGIPIAQLFEIPPSRRYSVNVLVDNSSLKGAPVILESHPSYTTLLGRIEHEAMMGATRTDFTMIQPGCLHRANGGYLVMPVRELLLNAYTWEGLKRVLRDGEIEIIEMGQLMGLLSTVTLEPQPIPLNLKVVLVGTPMLYYLIRTYEEDFTKLFKVRAEFATEMERTPETENEYGLFVKSVVVDNQLPRFDRSAVARIIEHSSRMAEDQEKLSTRFGKITDLVREAAYWAKERQAKSGVKRLLVTSRDVQQTIDEMIYRNNLIEERLQEMISSDVLMIDISGQVVGQVNALSVYLLGDYMFGRPSRLTAAAYPGSGGVIDIERQSKLGGPIHTKGVLILSGFLGGRYGRGRPLSLAASLTFEQSYDGVEGDSASAAELLVLLSAIAQVPLRQDRAITGSINQHGQVQAIGGVNEKIEGFYATCKARRLTGEQGVIIPVSNLRSLMLNDEVVQAVKKGKFHVWPVNHVDGAIKLMTGLEPGELQAGGSYPEGTFNYLVTKRLAELAKAVETARKEASQKQGVNDNEQSGT
jgi:lon-related putative ATP-dependent protease